MSEDYYKDLELRRDASQADIEKAYRDLARKYHPDLNPDDKGAKRKFQEVQTAFDVLNEPEKREMYDRYGSNFDSMGGGPSRGQGFPGGAGGAGGFDFGDIFGQGGGGGGGAGFQDIFSQMGGGGRGQRPQPPQRGADLQNELKIPFTTAIDGGEAQLSIRRSDARTETITVKIPAGIGDKKKIRLRGQGEAAPGGRGESGDILITVLVQSHPHFVRLGSNLEVQVPVSVAEAALGAKIEVPTPSGTITLTLPPGTSSGTKLRIKGHGAQPKGKPPGDLMAEIQIVLPKELDDETRELLEKISAQHAEDPRSDLKWK